MYNETVNGKVFFIAYDLTNSQYRSSDYRRIENLLLSVGAKRILINLWAYETPPNANANSIDIRNQLNPYFRPDDRLLVIDAVEWAWYLGTLVN